MGYRYNNVGGLTSQWWRRRVEVFRMKEREWLGWSMKSTNPALAILLPLVCLGCSGTPTVQTAQHPPWSSNEDRASRPYATRDGCTIRLEPSGATFRVPQQWVNRYGEFGNNFHLSHEQLDAVAEGEGEWDTEFASVCNAALPFDRCAAHVGDDGWGREGVSYGDLQVRVYEIGASLVEDIEKKGVAEVVRILKHVPSVERDASSPWQKYKISFFRWYFDYGATAHIDFRVRTFGARSMVFVFMYTDAQPQGSHIASILDSFSRTREGAP